MDVFIKNARLVQGNTVSEPQHILIHKGIIEAIGPALQAPNGVEVKDLQNACVSAGWFDLGAQTADPGFEHREDLLTAARAAAAGGFTALACFPNTQPAIHSKTEVQYIQNKTRQAPVRFYPIGAISQQCEGKDLAELYDMHAAGAVAFSDGAKAVQDAGLLLRALQYARSFNGLIINEPHHKTIAAGGQMHEGLASTMLGMKGVPALAEEMMVQRDLSLLEYSGGRLHIHLVSTAKSVALIRAAKQAGLPVTASVAVANLCFTDEVLLGKNPFGDHKGAFDSNFKVQPPLRSQQDADALLAGVLDGTIDLICSNHVPWDEEAKNLEFTYAEFGMSTLETGFALCRTFLADRLPLPVLIEKISAAPRRILGLPERTVQPGAVADLTFFHPDAEWVYEEKKVLSRSRNSPALGHRLKGQVLGTLFSVSA
jgi:dihydroorotase